MGMNYSGGGQTMFKEEREALQFDWSMIGNIGEGRPNLGNTMDVSVYRPTGYFTRPASMPEKSFVKN